MVSFIEKLRKIGRTITGEQRRLDESIGSFETISDRPVPSSVPTPANIANAELRGVSPSAASEASPVLGAGATRIPDFIPIPGESGRLDRDMLLQGVTPPSQVQAAGVRPVGATQEEILADIANQNFKQSMDQEFKETFRNIPELQRGFITFTNLNTGEEFKLNHAEYNALGKAKPNRSSILEQSEQVEEIRRQRLTLQATKDHLRAQLNSESLSVEMRRRNAGALADLEWSAGEFESLEQAAIILADWGLTLPPQLAADLSAVGVAESGAKAFGLVQAGKIAAKAAGKGATWGAKGTNIIGFLAWAAWTASSAAKNKQKNVDFADQIRTRVDSEIGRIESDIASGDFSAQETATKIDKMYELSRAAQVILKIEQGKFLSSQLTDVDRKLIEINILLEQTLPSVQRNVETAIIRPTSPIVGIPQ
ncbi:MAG TPA: hypothetical protein EYQ21_07480 [Flavobacteriales bacterium]|jgi:hypothetical protein|nr:hypothetical protein [Flavobacteriales bacterium]